MTQHLPAAVVGGVDDPAVVVAVHHAVADLRHVAQTVDGQHHVVEVEPAVGVPDDARRGVLLAGHVDGGECVAVVRAGPAAVRREVEARTRGHQQQGDRDDPAPFQDPPVVLALLALEVVQVGRGQDEQLPGGLLAARLGRPGPAARRSGQLVMDQRLDTRLPAGPRPRTAAPGQCLGGRGRRLVGRYAEPHRLLHQRRPPSGHVDHQVRVRPHAVSLGAEAAP